MATRTVTDNTTAQNGSPDFTDSGVEDGYLRQAVSSENNGTDARIKISKYGASDHNHGLIQFDISNIPADQTITDATIYLKVETAPGSEHTIDLRALLVNWGETTSSWQNYETATAWNTAGGLGAASDRQSATSGSIVVGTGSDETYVSADITGIVQDWYDGTLTNNGLHLERNGAGEDGQELFFHSSEATDGNRPELFITYSSASSGVGKLIGGGLVRA